MMKSIIFVNKNLSIFSLKPNQFKNFLRAPKNYLINYY